MILIIDDSLTVRMDLDEAFRSAGLATRLCATATEARQALESRLPALIILDVLLPDGDGLDLLAEMRSYVGLAHTPVILLSTEAEVRDRIRGLTHGADEYVGKPYDAAYVVARARALLREKSGLDPRANELTILVIDDSMTYRHELAENLQEAGYRTELAASGAEGLQRAADIRPDAIIVDGVMEEMDGTAVVRRIRLDPGLHPTPCLLLTASEGAAGEVLALDAGADAYVRKGEGIDVILARLSAVLRMADSSRNRAHAASLMGPKRILAVDDSLTFLEETAEQLRADGYEVVKAKSGEEALELLAVENVDCILLDLLMPGLSGTETCQRIKNSPASRHVPLIMLTALEDPKAVVEGMNAGADDYVSKSVDFDVIKARLRAQLRRKQFEDENRRVREEILRKDAETRAAQAQAEARAALLRELEKKNRELELLNQELQMFAYSVSHDLRQPLRSMEGFSRALVENHREQLEPKALHYLSRIQAGAERMDALIDGLLVLSKVSREALQEETVQLDKLADRVLDRLRDADPERKIHFQVERPLVVRGDPKLLESMLENLLGNAWKFTTKVAHPKIEIGKQTINEESIYYVRDNGSGFKMDYAERLFTPFQRLHSEQDFPGTGIGLATTQRIVRRHRGRIWAESQPEEGATFFFTLAGTQTDDGAPT